MKHNYAFKQTSSISLAASSTKRKTLRGKAKVKARIIAGKNMPVVSIVREAYTQAGKMTGLCNDDLIDFAKLRYGRNLTRAQINMARHNMRLRGELEAHVREVWAK